MRNIEEIARDAVGEKRVEEADSDLLAASIAVREELRHLAQQKSYRDYGSKELIENLATKKQLDERDQ